MGDPVLFIKVIKAVKENNLSSRYFHTYNFYCIHINISDLYDETHSLVQGWLTLTYFLMSQRLIKEKSLSSRYLHTYNMYYFHINSSDLYDETQLFISAHLYRFHIHAIDKPYNVCRSSLCSDLFLSSNMVMTISQKTRAKGDKLKYMMRWREAYCRRLWF